MPSFDIKTTPLPGLLVLTPSAASRPDGTVLLWSDRMLAQAGVCPAPLFVQDNQSVSTSAGTIRGLHYQAPPRAQGKLMRCARGRIFDVAVDARLSSPTFGRWFGIELSAENRRQLWVPAGFLHGFCTREPDTEVLYKTTEPYDAALDGAVRWDSVGIDWGLDLSPVLSQKDSAAPAFAAWTSPFP